MKTAPILIACSTWASITSVFVCMHAYEQKTPHNHEKARMLALFTKMMLSFRSWYRMAGVRRHKRMSRSHRTCSTETREQGVTFGDNLQHNPNAHTHTVRKNLRNELEVILLQYFIEAIWSICQDTVEGKKIILIKLSLTYYGTSNMTTYNLRPASTPVYFKLLICLQNCTYKRKCTKTEMWNKNPL